MVVEAMTACQRGHFGLHGTGAALLPAAGGHGPNGELFSWFADLLPGGNSCCVRWNVVL